MAMAEQKLLDGCYNRRAPEHVLGKHTAQSAAHFLPYTALLGAAALLQHYHPNGFWSVSATTC
jgi:hypothetical protein